MLALDTSLLLTATLAYGVALGLTLMRVLRLREPAHQINFLLILAGCLFQSIGLWMRGMDAGSCPIRNPFEVLQFVSWSVVLIYLFTGKVFRLSLFGTGCASLAALLSISAFVLPGSNNSGDLSRLSENPWIETHAALAFFSYGIFGLLAVVSILYLIQNSSLKRKRTSRAFQFLPSIVDMETVLGRLLLTATFVFSTAMVIGGVYWVQHPEHLGSLKLILTNLLWLAWLVVAGLRLARRLYGTRLASICLVLFVVALLMLWPIEADRSPEPEPSAIGFTSNPADYVA